MPLVSADPFGGVIITDWYTPSHDAGRALQGQHLHPRPRAAGRRRARHGVPSGQSRRRLGRRAGRAQDRDRSRERDPDPRAPDADRRLAAVAPVLRRLPLLMSALQFPGGRAQMAGGLGRAALLRGADRRRQAEILRARDVPLSVGAHPYGPCAQLHDGRRGRPLSSARRASTCCIRWAGTPSACRPRTRHGARRPSGHWTYDNIATMRAQLKRWACRSTGSREIATCDPEYYRHEQAHVPRLPGGGPRLSQGSHASTGTRSTRPCSPTSR